MSKKIFYYVCKNAGFFIKKAKNVFLNFGLEAKITSTLTTSLKYVMVSNTITFHFHCRTSTLHIHIKEKKGQAKNILEKALNCNMVLFEISKL